MCEYGITLALNCIQVFTVQDTMSGMTVFLVDQVTQLRYGLFVLPVNNCCIVPQITKVVVSDFYSATIWASSLHKVAETVRCIDGLLCARKIKLISSCSLE